MKINNREPKQDKRPIRYIEKMIESLSDRIFPEARKQGINIGKNSPPKQEADILEIPYVGTITAKVTALFNDISGSLEEKIQEYKTKFEQGYNQLKDNNIITSLTSKQKGLESLKETDLKEVDTNTEQERNENLAAQSKLEKQISQNDVAIGEHPYKDIFWPMVFAVFFSLGILSSEIFVNQKAFLFQAGENFFTSFMIALGISLVTFLFGFATAKVIQSDKISITNKIIYISLLSIAFIGVAYGVAEMRTKMMTIMSEGQTGRASFIVSKLTLILINIGFYVGLIIIKILLVPDPSVFACNQQNRAFEKDTKAKKNALNKLKTEIKKLPKKAHNQKKEIKEKYSKESLALEKEVNNNYNQLREYQLGYNKYLSIAKNVHKQLSNLAKQAISVFIQQVNLFSIDDSQIKISKDSIPDLENPFEDYPYMDTNTIDLLFNTETFKTPDYENH
jgi:hypothetical protein